MEGENILSSTPEEIYQAAKVCLTRCLTRFDLDWCADESSAQLGQFLTDRFDEFRDECFENKLKYTDWKQVWINEFREMLADIKSKIEQSKEFGVGDNAEKIKKRLVEQVETFLVDLQYIDSVWTLYEDGFVS